jgi:hypothetical protein
MSTWENDCENEWDGYEEEEKIARKRHSIFNTPERKVHKTWNGKPVQHMDSDHIINALMFCEKKFVEGETNHRLAHQGTEDFYFRSVADMFPEYANLREEWSKRLKG